MVTLRDKFFGCIAASNIASAMGAAVEGMDYWEIERKHGYLDELLPYSHYNGRDRMAGTTEDGIERQRLLSTAYIEKERRIDAEDLRRIWLRDIEPENFGKQMEPCDEILYRLAEAGMPAREIGSYSDYPGIVSFVRSCHPVGLVNAADPETAAKDGMELGSLYQSGRAYGLQWGACYIAALAQATRPEATVQSVIDTALQVVPKEPRALINRGQKLAEEAGSYEELRDAFYDIYDGRGIKYGMSTSQELVPKGFALFKFMEGNPKKTILGAVNFGRDTDCTAAIAAGLSGALRGSEEIPREWIEQVDKATKANEYTVSQRSLRETADGLQKACKGKAERIKGVLAELKESGLDL